MTNLPKSPPGIPNRSCMVVLGLSTTVAGVLGRAVWLVLT